MNVGIRAISAVIVLAVFLLGAGCGGGPNVKTAPAEEKEYIFYPPPPNPPRYQYLTSFYSTKDFVKKKSKFFKFIAGEDKKEVQRIIRKAYGVDMYDGIIYVCDIGAGGVVKINLKARRFDLLGVSGRGKLLKPVNLLIDRKEKLLYVADIVRKQVICYTLDGKARKFYGQQDQFAGPTDVDHDEDKLFVCDVNKHQVIVIDKKDGKTLYTIGEPGSKEGQLFHPTNICIHDGRLYVSDTTNFRVQVFDLAGKFLASFGQAGRVPGTFARNKGIAVDKEGRIYVVESKYDKVQVFDRDFRLLLFMFDPGNEKHNINLAAGIAIDYDNVDYFKEYISPGFHAEYLLFVTSYFGKSRVNVYAFGTSSK
ncbi:MAG: 6-bladed beta-propeller [Candidatus Aminicenantes bacterium]|nr:6-bladed beta-propeller [Candidatus Aminicenantes bacterium]NIM79353.1 6-bladed beta-propeller [Candidatus Aminicenantes bacterium]NIN18630.1 6-bladed beta-propeller [Candidatus Aminicenantes bacterium]NIN42519.1 6-bladed beta-propeller [Candidatus Aminicenantes bacterium]NIN85285.1 6-bladed beta-propeller [Candidatus Aminicenantes bacterium]